jgi:MFS family permease
MNQEKEAMNPSVEEDSLFNPGFLILTSLFLVASSAVAAFFQLQPYLVALGIDPAWIGFVISADSIASFLIQPLCAPYLHKGNYRRWMAIGIVVMAVSLISYSFAAGIFALVVIRIVQGAGFVTFLAAMMAGIVICIPQSKSGQGFGVLSLVRLVPYALAPPLVTYLIDNAVSFPTVLLGFALLVCLSLALFFWLPGHDSRLPGDSEPSPHGKVAAEEMGRPAGLKGTIEGLKDKKIQALLLVNTIVFICYTVAFFYISGFGRQAGLRGTRFFFTVATVMMVAVRLAGSRLFDKLDKLRLVSWCLVALAACFLFLPYSHDWSLYGLAGVFGISWGIVMPLLNAMVFDASPAPLKGVNLNLTLVAMQGGFFLGPLAGGFILAAHGYSVLFMLCCPLTLLALGILTAGYLPIATTDVRTAP